jgi:hypothetical protein
LKITIAALLLLASSAFADTVIRCESDGSRRDCRFDGPADVSMSRQLSRSSCDEGRSWGVTGNRIWVDRGCRAEFLVADRNDRRGHGETIICESDGHKRRCSADTSYGVHLSRQLSRASCEEGRSWGFNNNGIWVDDGCRAEFTLGNRGRRDRDRDGYGRRAETLVCESDYGKSHTCSVDTRAGIRMTRQISKTDCIYGRTWGYNNSGVWVRDGCRAEFTVGR